MFRPTFTLRHAVLALALACPAAPAAESPLPKADAVLGGWIQEMKEAPRGPFDQVRWFCTDGAILEPTPHGCAEHGGGIQHGQWSERTRQIRAAGYPIANVLAAMPPQSLAGGNPDADFLAILLLERFLIAADDGWILRRAQYYRGALQDYNEKDQGGVMLRALLDGESAATDQFVVAREAVRLLPHGAETPLFTQVRGLAATLAEQDPEFLATRVRIHNAPQPEDAARVRAYAAGSQGKPELREDYARLAATIDRSYLSRALPASLQLLVRQVREPALAQRLRDLAQALASHPDAASQYRLAADVMVLVRAELAGLRGGEGRLAAMDASLAAEAVVFTASRELQRGLAGASRAQRLAWIGTAARASHGLGLLNVRELAQIERSLAGLAAASVPLADYRERLQELERAPAWASRRLDYHFGNAVERLERIEPLARAYTADRLRGSVMLFYSDLLDSLVRDAGQLSGLRHYLFGAESAGLRRLNPGIARGILRLPAEAATAGPRPAIYLVAETSSDLPPAAGIITAEEGNALSHVQLLARNLGIPNVVAGSKLLAELAAHRGDAIVIAASAGGLVRIEADSPAWDRVLGNAQAARPRAIEVNLAKLQLDRRELLPTDRLRAADAGRSVGPKAAQVGELSHHFPGQVSAGLAVPFGVYRALLDRPSAPGAAPMIEWLRVEYDQLALRKSLDPEHYARRLPEVLAYARQWFAKVELDAQWRQQLFDAMHDRFGMDGTYGVFVRSDTNVEDLPGFTGAGLNLTVPNVVGIDAVIEALRRVWASPFSDRAFGWRQDLMDAPEHVYASVLLHRSIASDKSGVLVTADIDSGDRAYLTVATNVGVAGAVDGQAAEALRVSLATGQAQLLSSATARTRMELLAQGGAHKVASTAPEYVLTSAEIARLVEFVRALPADYPGLKDADGAAAPADIEFAFARGQLMLLQIRPFLQNRAAAGNAYLNAMDAGLRGDGGAPVDLRRVPDGAAS